MKAVIQRVKKASVSSNGNLLGEIEQGLLVLLGVAPEDDEFLAKKLLDKIIKLRIFSDENDKMNLSLLDIKGEMLIVSNFTLYADCKHGCRPSFTASAKPDLANKLYEEFISLAKQSGVSKVQTGEFGADMQIELCNDGPITIVLDTDELVKKH